MKFYKDVDCFWLPLIFVVGNISILAFVIFVFLPMLAKAIQSM